MKGEKGHTTGATGLDGWHLGAIVAPQSTSNGTPATLGWSRSPPFWRLGGGRQKAVGVGPVGNGWGGGDEATRWLDLRALGALCLFISRSCPAQMQGEPPLSLSFSLILYHLISLFEVCDGCLHCWAEVLWVFVGLILWKTRSRF